MLSLIRHWVVSREYVLITEAHGQSSVVVLGVGKQLAGGGVVSSSRGGGRGDKQYSTLRDRASGAV
jgi:hypothetical protein